MSENANKPLEGGVCTMRRSDGLREINPTPHRSFLAMTMQLIALFLLLCLPLQGWAAAVIPVWQHAAPGEKAGEATAQATGSRHASMHQYAPVPRHASVPQDTMSSDNACSACNLEAAQVVASVIYCTAVVRNSTHPHAAAQILSLFQPEPRDRPPSV